LLLGWRRLLVDAILAIAHREQRRVGSLIV
jgi:hypothetical protein